MRLTFVCGLPRSTIFFPHYLLNDTIFEKQSYWTQNVCFDFLHIFCLKYFSFWEDLSKMWSHMCRGLHVKYLLFLSDLNETWIFLDRFSKSTQISNFTRIMQWEPSGSVGTDSQLRRSQQSLFAVSLTRLKTSQSMLYREIMAVCCEIHTKHITWIIYKDPVRTAQ